MKTTSDFLRPAMLACSLMIAAVTGASAQDKKPPAAPVGFLRIANAVAPGTGNVKVKVDGKDVFPMGYKFAAVTGGIGMPPGSHKVSFTREGVEEGSTTVTLEKDQTVTLIPFAEKVPATDQKPAHFAIRILRLKQKEVPEGREASFVSVSGQPEVMAELRDPAGNWQKIPVKRLSIGQGVIRYPEGYVPVKVNGKDMESIPISDTGNYVVLLYDDPEGKLHSINFRDFKYLSAD